MMSSIMEVFHFVLLAVSRKENYYFSFRLVYNLYGHANTISYVAIDSNDSRIVETKLKGR